MESERTTEELYHALDPQAREEAVRLAARIQMEREADRHEGASLVAAAREAGIDDRSLREAVGRMARTGPEQTHRGPEAEEGVRPWIVGSRVVGFTLLQPFVMMMAFYDVANPDPLAYVLRAIALLAAAWLGTTFARTRRPWAGAAIVALVSAGLIALIAWRVEQLSFRTGREHLAACLLVAAVQVAVAGLAAGWRRRSAPESVGDPIRVPHP